MFYVLLCCVVALHGVFVGVYILIFFATDKPSTTRKTNIATIVIVVVVCQLIASKCGQWTSWSSQLRIQFATKWRII